MCNCIRILLLGLLLFLRKCHKDPCQDIWTYARFIWTKIFHGRALLTTLLPSRLDTTRDANLWLVVAQGIFLTLSELLTHNIYNCIYQKKYIQISSNWSSYKRLFQFKTIVRTLYLHGWSKQCWLSQYYMFLSHYILDDA